MNKRVNDINKYFFLSLLFRFHIMYRITKLTFVPVLLILVQRYYAFISSKKHILFHDKSFSLKREQIKEDLHP
jgi:hypothetical protein